jgi:hypothetical protein
VALPCQASGDLRPALAGGLRFFLALAPSNPRANSAAQSLIGSGADPTLLKHIVRNIDNHMSQWKVIALINGDVEAVSGPAAPGLAGSRRMDGLARHSR